MEWSNLDKEIWEKRITNVRETRVNTLKKELDEQKAEVEKKYTEASKLLKEITKRKEEVTKELEKKTALREQLVKDEEELTKKIEEGKRELDAVNEKIEKLVVSAW